MNASASDPGTGPEAGSELDSGLVAVAALCVVAVGAAWVLGRGGAGVYRFVLGDLDPTLTTGVVSVLGVASLLVLKRLHWFTVRGGGRRGFVVAAVAGVLLTLPVILVDGFGGFPEEMNVPWPASLLFYPSIALVAEFSFHAIPLTLLALGARMTAIDPARARLLAMMAVCTIEPALQVIWGADTSPLWANGYVGVHLVAFNAVAVHLFRRHGFLTMYAFRFTYYLVWHIVWGALRLPLLFGAEI